MLVKLSNGLSLAEIQFADPSTNRKYGVFKSRWAFHLPALTLALNHHNAKSDVDPKFRRF